MIRLTTLVAAVPTPLGDRVELRELFVMARRQWALSAAFMLAGLAVAGIVMLQATPQYESSAALFVSASDRKDTGTAYEGSLLSANRVTSYAELTVREELSRRVIDRLDLDVHPRDLVERIRAQVEPDTVVLEISVTDSSPEQARRIMWVLTDELTSFIAELETTSATARPPINATVIDPPSRPTSPISPQPVRDLGLGATLGLLVGLGVAVVRELHDTSVRTQEDVEELTGTPVRGLIPFDPTAVRSPVAASSERPGVLAEAFRVLRTNLLFVDVDRQKKVFVVTSSAPGEGKTTTAVNLAAMLAQAEQRVLLLEGDLRKPEVTERLALEPAVGLTSVLMGQVTLADAVQESALSPYLSVLTSGPVPPNPSELLQSRAMAEVLDTVRKTYDVVIVDAPALLPVTDSALLAAQCDGALVVVRSGRTTEEQLGHAMDRLRVVGGQPVGTVLNMVPRRRTSTGDVKAYLPPSGDMAPHRPQGQVT